MAGFSLYEIRGISPPRTLSTYRALVLYDGRAEEVEGFFLNSDGEIFLALPLSAPEVEVLLVKGPLVL